MKQILRLSFIVCSSPFILLGIIGSFFRECFVIGDELLDCFLDWLAEKD